MDTYLRLLRIIKENYVSAWTSSHVRSVPEIREAIIAAAPVLLAAEKQLARAHRWLEKARGPHDADVSFKLEGASPDLSIPFSRFGNLGILSWIWSPAMAKFSRTHPEGTDQWEFWWANHINGVIDRQPDKVDDTIERLEALKGLK